MLALTTTPEAPYVSLSEVAEPIPSADQALVTVVATSLNRGEVLDLPGSPPGKVAGWDIAGVVSQAASDSSGAPVGTRVVGLVRSGAWAQLVAVPTALLAPIPDAVSDSQAAALPTAGLTALRSLEIAGLLVGKRVLIAGATGGVGRIAVQLARESGARVSALVRNLGASRGLIHRLGGTAVDVVEGDFDAIIDGVGGHTFGRAIEHLAPRGVVVSIATDTEEEQVSFRATGFDRSSGARIYTLNLPDELAWHSSGTTDLTRLCRLVVEGRLDPQVELEVSWRESGAAIDALLQRRVGGKIVLAID